ncbi:helix-turn-helix domain-containing protein [Streptomyces mexicanus]|uniref:Helix-turn-helix transcriptional regulator n=1 Tax=Streptomyces mexicanus TaxID=178566 RepID=A0A7X1HYS6_9ACTN|nr:helix-turn-helix transcriptional regulator [Streptomyces mexicanus]MBC2865684.1 helix-turn-helix transcriptional regulator [Streptomyces mexicanus]
MASLNVGNLGEYLREQRRNAQLSLRQLADAAGVSNPYLSQIERGLRKPSAEVLQQVAKALRISAETLYVRAGILDAERDRDEVETCAVILADPTLNERQKQVLLQIYESFRKENGFGSGRAGDGDAAGKSTPDTTGDEGHDGSPERHGADGDATAHDSALDPGLGTASDDANGGAIPSAAVPEPDGGRPAPAERRTRTSGGSDADPRQAAG